MSEHWRLFIAIDLGVAARLRLAEALSSLRALPLPVRWIDPAGAHLTLRFLGDTDRAQIPALTTALQSVAARHTLFQLQTDALGAFPNLRRPRVFWLGLGGALPALLALHKTLEERLTTLEIPREARPFSPHLTLGRLREGARPPDPATLEALFRQLQPLPPAPIPASAIHLIRSQLTPHGARYTTVATAELRRAG